MIKMRKRPLAPSQRFVRVAMLILTAITVWTICVESGMARGRLFRRRCKPSCYVPSSCCPQGVPPVESGGPVCAVYYGGQAGDLHLHYGMPFNSATGECSGSAQAIYLENRVFGIPPCIDCTVQGNEELCVEACIDFMVDRKKHGCEKGYPPNAPIPADVVAQHQIGGEILGNFLFEDGRIKLLLFRTRIPQAPSTIVGVGYEYRDGIVGSFPDRNQELIRKEAGSKCCTIVVQGRKYHVLLNRDPKP